MSLDILPTIKEGLDTFQNLPRKDQKKNLDKQKLLLRVENYANYNVINYSMMAPRLEESYQRQFPWGLSVEDCKERLLKDIDFCKQRLAAVKDAHSLLVHNLKYRLSLCSGEEYERQGCRVARGAEDTLNRILMVNRCRLVSLHDDPVINATNRHLQQYNERIAGIAIPACEAMICGKGSVDDYKTLMTVAEDYLAHGEQFCFAAATRFQSHGNAELWQDCINLAKVVSDLSSVYQTIAEESFVNKPDSRFEAYKPASDPAEGKGKAKVAESSTGKSSRKSRGKNTQKTATKKAPTPQKDESALQRNETLKKVNQQFRLWRGAPPGTDPIAVARAMPEKDTRVIDALSGDPLSVAHQKRHWTDTWFGSMQKLGGLKQQLLKLGDDPEVSRRIAELDACLERRGEMEKALDRQKSDTLKTYNFPKALHLKDLLDRGEVDSRGVSAPVRLSSEGDVGDKGTLFEVRVQPKPLSDGRPSPAVYLHLHTDKAVSKEDLPRLDAESFTAVHLKTQDQRNLGRRWEQLTGALGTVHRGRVEGELRQQILQMAAQV